MRSSTTLTIYLPHSGSVADGVLISLRVAGLQGHYHYFAAFSPFHLAFPEFKPPFTTPIGVFFAPLLGSIGRSSRPRAPEFANFSLRLLGELSDESGHTHFYDSDYTAHHRPEYAVFVHSVSSRTLSTECVNTENKKGRMLADGATTVYSRGEQYENVFPLLNWTLLPVSPTATVAGLSTIVYLSCGLISSFLSIDVCACVAGNNRGTERRTGSRRLSTRVRRDSQGRHPTPICWRVG